MPQSDGVNKLKRMEFEFKGKAYKFNLNPEEYTQEEPQRSTVTQTKGGAWIDDFGSGLFVIFIKGSTGMTNGFTKFKELRQTIRDYKNNITPGARVVDELVFHNYTDEESWIVHVDPSGFKLFRSKSNPLMFMYEIRLVCMRNANEPAPGTKSPNGVTNKSKNSPATPIGKLFDVQGDLISAQFSSFTGTLPILNNGAVQLGN